MNEEDIEFDIVGIDVVIVNVFWRIFIVEVLLVFCNQRQNFYQVIWGLLVWLKYLFIFFIFLLGSVWVRFYCICINFKLDLLEINVDDYKE